MLRLVDNLLYAIALPGCQQVWGITASGCFNRYVVPSPTSGVENLMSAQDSCFA